MDCVGIDGKFLLICVYGRWGSVLLILLWFILVWVCVVVVVVCLVNVWFCCLWVVIWMDCENWMCIVCVEGMVSIYVDFGMFGSVWCVRGVMCCVRESLLLYLSIVVVIGNLVYMCIVVDLRSLFLWCVVCVLYVWCSFLVLMDMLWCVLDWICWYIWVYGWLCCFWVVCVEGCCIGEIWGWIVCICCWLIWFVMEFRSWFYDGWCVCW